jgi:hypothetical protein
MKHLQQAIELPDPWTRTGISQRRYELASATRRERKHAAAIANAQSAINKAHKRMAELRQLAKTRRELIPEIAVRMVSLRDNSHLLEWELKLALDSDDISPWKTVKFYSDNLLVWSDKKI